MNPGTWGKKPGTERLSYDQLTNQAPNGRTKMYAEITTKQMTV
jgi:hypothetical protein